MQNVFSTQLKPGDFAVGSETAEYPPAPRRCPFKDCRKRVTLKKHGFYTRYLVTEEWHGRIRIRRYKCPKCGHTVSMLPFFCHPYFIIGFELIVSLMRSAVKCGSVRKTAKAAAARGITRRHVRFYLGRLRQNRTLIDYGLRQISPGAASYDEPPGDTAWTRNLLLEMRPPLCPELNAGFHKETGVSFMSTHKMIA